MIRCFAFTVGSHLRVLQIEEIKSVPNTPVSHPFVERLIGTSRRECLGRAFFWNAVDLARKLAEFRHYYNAHRVHRSLDGTTPAQRAGASSPALASLGCPAWQQHCRSLFQTPIAASLGIRHPQEAADTEADNGGCRAGNKRHAGDEGNEPQGHAPGLPCVCLTPCR